MGMRSKRIGRQPFQGQAVRNMRELQGCRAAIRLGGSNALVALPGNRGYAPAADRLQLLGSAAARKIETIAPTSSILNLDLLFDPNSNRVAMKGEVTIGQMRQFVEETGYKAAGHKADEFTRRVAEGNASDPMVFTNEADCLAFIKWALPKVQAQDPRIETLGLPSDEEWLSMQQTFSGRLTGKFWERLSDGAFRSFHDGDRDDYLDPENRCSYYAFRLVGTYKKS